MAGALGYVCITNADRDGGTIERDAYLCAHCQLICIVQPGSKKKRGFCFMCMAPTCGRKGCVERCIPFEARLEAEEGTRRFWKQVDLLRP